MEKIIEFLNNKDIIMPALLYIWVAAVVHWAFKSEKMSKERYDAEE